MRKLYILFAFLMGWVSVFGQTSVTLTEDLRLADALADEDISSITTLIVSGVLTEEDFETMDEDMTSLQVLDMSGVTDLPVVDEDDNLVGIPASAFRWNETLQEVVFPDIMETIGKQAFCYCSNLETVNLSNCSSLKEIGEYAFCHCSSLETIDFSNCFTLNSLDVLAFCVCTALERIIINNDYYSSEDGVLFDASKSTLLCYPLGKEDETYTIPSTVTTISSGSIYINSGSFIFSPISGSISSFSLKEITIPNTVQTIEEGAFYGSTDYLRLTVTMEAETPIELTASIGLENQLVYVPVGSGDTYKEADYWCDSQIFEIGSGEVSVTLETAGTLEESLEGSVSSILDLTVSGPMNSTDFLYIRNNMDVLLKIDLSEAEFEDNILPARAFYNHDNLAEVILPQSVEQIGGYAFYSCGNLQAINLTSLSQLNTIGTYAFSYCTSLPTTLQLPDEVETLETSAFDDTNVSIVDLTNTMIKTINEYTFNYCDGLTEIVLPATLQSLEYKAFYAYYVSSIKLRSLEVVEWNSTNAIYGVDKSTCIVYVPKGMKDEYQSHTYWSAFENIVEFGHLITVVSNDETSGTVIGSGGYEAGETAILRATPIGSALFSGWYDEDGNLVSSDLNYYYTVEGTEDQTFTARFSSEDITIGSGETVTIDDSDKVDGVNVTLQGYLTVDGDDTWALNEFNYYQGSTVVPNAETTAEEIHFLWNTSGSQWYFVSFPYDLKLSEIELSDSDTQFVVREYDGATRAANGTGDSWKQLDDDDTMEAYKGYIIQFDSSDGSYDSFNAASGMETLLSHSAVTVSLTTYTASATQDANWNLVGNPYPAYYNVGALYDEGFDGTIAVWSDDLENYEYYTSDDEGEYLDPLVGFFVQKGTSDLKFVPDGRSASLSTTKSAVTRSGTSDRQVINLLLSNASASDRTRVVFNEEASLDYEIGLDVAKFSSLSSSAPSFFSLDGDGNRLAINERPVDDGVVSLGYYAPTAGEYTIGLKEAVDMDLFLVDNETGYVFDLSQGEYSFTATKGTTTGRFELRRDVVTSVEGVEDAFTWTVRDGMLTLTGVEAGTTLLVYDAAGRMHYAGTVTDGSVHLNLSHAGVYYMTLVTKSGKRTVYPFKW